MYCYLCLNEYAGITETFCSKCKRVKHLINIYNDRVYDVLEEVLVRAKDKQDNKIRVELKKEIEKREYSLRSKDTKLTEVSS